MTYYLRFCYGSLINKLSLGQQKIINIARKGCAVRKNFDHDIFGDYNRLSEKESFRERETQIAGGRYCNSGAATGNRNLALRLLEGENRILHQQLTCKVCFQKPIKDLFLPCGDLFACTDCSKLLTHCPACNKQILATVTTYFT